MFWGYALFLDRIDNFVPKAMADCSGAEILTELCGHPGAKRGLHPWVRNLAQRESASFFFQKATGRFYPDELKRKATCKLMNSGEHITHSFGAKKNS